MATLNSVADPHHLDAETDPVFHFNADLDPDPDLTFQHDANSDPDPDPTTHFFRLDTSMLQNGPLWLWLSISFLSLDHWYERVEVNTVYSVFTVLLSLDQLL